MDQPILNVTYNIANFVNKFVVMFELLAKQVAPLIAAVKVCATSFTNMRCIVSWLGQLTGRLSPQLLARWGGSDHPQRDLRQMAPLVAVVKVLQLPSPTCVLLSQLTGPTNRQAISL